MNWSFLPQYIPLIVKGTVTTLELSVLSLAGGAAVGGAVAVIRLISGPVTNAVFGLLVDLVRTTPLLVQLLIWYLAPGVVNISLDPFAASVLALSVNAGAFISEIVRGAVLGVPRGQREAALSVGLSALYSVVAIELPQAIPAIAPALVGYYIALIKDTSIAYIVGLLELTRTGSFIANQEFRPIETFLVVAAIYFVICFPLARLVPIVDRRMRRAGLAQERLSI